MIAIIADGRWGERIVRTFRKLHRTKAVTWGVRSTEFARELLEEVENVSISSYEEAIATHPMIVLAMPCPDLLPWAKMHADQLQGKIVVDISLPFTEEEHGIPYGWTTSMTEELQKCLPGSRIVGAKSLSFHPVPPKEQAALSTVYVTSDNDGGKRQVLDFFRGSALLAVDAGALEENRAIDRMLSLEEIQRELTLYGNAKEVYSS